MLGQFAIRFDGPGATSTVLDAARSELVSIIQHVGRGDERHDGSMRGTNHWIDSFHEIVHQ